MPAVLRPFSVGCVCGGGVGGTLVLVRNTNILSPSQKEWRFRIQNLSQKERRFT
jgi:hypothetical protein